MNAPNMGTRTGICVERAEWIALRGCTRPSRKIRFIFQILTVLAILLLPTLGGGLQVSTCSRVFFWGLVLITLHWVRLDAIVDNVL